MDEPPIRGDRRTVVSPEGRIAPRSRVIPVHVLHVPWHAYTPLMPGWSEATMNAM